MTNRIPVLAPSRADRIRLEALLADVWTRDIIPYPGMTGRARNEHPVRVSASSMMRKLSVASITSNFTKRSGSMASLHKTVEDDSPTEAELQKSPSARIDHTSSGAATFADVDDLTRSRLSIIQDEKENLQHSSREGSSIKRSPNDSPIGTVRRLATLKAKTGWAPDGQRTITPPLRTSSANSVNQTKTTTFSATTDVLVEEKENVPQIAQITAAQKPRKNSKWGKGNGKNRAVVAEGIRNLFR